MAEMQVGGSLPLPIIHIPAHLKVFKIKINFVIGFVKIDPNCTRTEIHFIT